MTTEKVYSFILDKFIKHNIAKSPIWKNCYHESDNKEPLTHYSKYYIYSIKFEGLKPIQVTKVEQINN
jgi:hypothetical protein